MVDDNFVITEQVSSAKNMIAKVNGETVTELPKDLFIPPDALEILLDSFSGPLDLLLYLIRRQNIDIMDIPIVIITRQYLEYIHILEKRKIELAADYLVMAAVLAEIKSKLLLPIHINETTEAVEEDPRAELVKRLIVYEQFKQAALKFNSMCILGRDTFSIKLDVDGLVIIKTEQPIELFELTKCMYNLFRENQHEKSYVIQPEVLSVKERMMQVLDQFDGNASMNFIDLYQEKEGRKGLVVALLAMLELAKQNYIIIKQSNYFEPILLIKRDLSRLINQ